MKGKIVDKEVNQLQKDKNITTSSFTKLNTPSHKVLRQNDVYNCGVFVLWYHLYHLKGKGFMVESDIFSTSIRHQILLYLFCLKVYFRNLKKIDKNKSMLQNVIELEKSEFGEALNNILKEIKVKEIKNVKMEIIRIMSVKKDKIHVI